MYICHPLSAGGYDQHQAKRNPHRGVEQLVARRAHNPKVAGSSPAPATKKTQESAYDADSFVFAVIYEILIATLSLKIRRGYNFVIDIGTTINKISKSIK